MTHANRCILSLVVAVALVAGVTGGSSAADRETDELPSGDHTMTLTSTAFAEGGPIPEQFSCDGANVSPPLRWTDAPADAKSFALICDDPDAPGGKHRYFFKLYALDAVLDLSPGATKSQLVQAMEGHILAEGQLMGTYER